MSIKQQLGGLQFAWQEGFLQQEAYPSSFAHHGMATLTDGRLVSGHPQGPFLQYFNPQTGERIKQVPIDFFNCAHGITVGRWHKEEVLLIADHGQDDHGSVAICSCEGEFLRRISHEDIPHLREHFLSTGFNRR